MPASDRSWTIAPTLLWFGAVLAGAFIYLDGDVHAIADRLTTRRETQRAPGPVVTAPAVEVAEADEPEVTPALPPPVPGSHDVAALDDTCLDGGDDACKRWAMDAFYKAVAEEKDGTLGRPVRVSWYGDSVIASDQIPGRLRQKLQRELGDGGPGFVFVVPPHRFCEHEAVSRSAGGGWATHAISVMQTPDGLYGPGGATAETDGGRATIKLVSGKVTNVDVYYLAQPRGGTATLTGDGGELLRAETAGDAKVPGYAAATSAGVSTIELATKGRVRLFGVDLENAHGAVVDNFGVVSVNVKSWANADAPHWGAELGHRGADLILVTIGANEAHWLAPGDKDTRDYQGHFEELLTRIRSGRPEASCLVVSPTDQAMAEDGAYPSRPVMPVLVEAQRKAAHATGCAFYSTYDWMGGKGSSAKWFRRGLVGSDFTHLTQKGANKLADALFDALMTGYQRYGSH
jgi:lysophospholipase L1-like esterase